MCPGHRRPQGLTPHLSLLPSASVGHMTGPRGAGPALSTRSSCTSAEIPSSRLRKRLPTTRFAALRECDANCEEVFTSFCSG